MNTEYAIKIEYYVFSLLALLRHGMRRAGDICAALFYFALGLAACVAQAVAGEPGEFD